MTLKPRPAFAVPDYAVLADGKSRVAAIKALADGRASGQQQIDAVNAILAICLVDDLPWFPDDLGGERDSSFAAGRVFVGREIRRVITQQFHKLTGEAIAPETEPRSSRKRKS